MTAPWHFAGYRKRRLICVPTSHATATYFAVSFTPHDGDFWAEVQSDGYDVRFIGAREVPGATASVHNRASWAHASKTATFNVAYSNPYGSTNYTHFYWMYYDSETTVAVDPSAAVTTTTPVTVSMYSGAPAGQVVDAIQPAEVLPSQTFTFGAGSAPYLWFRFGEAALGPSTWRGADNRMASPLFLEMIDWSGGLLTDLFQAGVSASGGLIQQYTVATEDDGDVCVGVVPLNTQAAGEYIAQLFARLTKSPGGAAGTTWSPVTALATIITPSEV